METRENWAFTNCPNYNSALSLRGDITSLGIWNYERIRPHAILTSLESIITPKSHNTINLYESYRKKRTVWMLYCQGLLDSLMTFLDN